MTSTLKAYGWRGGHVGRRVAALGGIVGLLAAMPAVSACGGNKGAGFSQSASNDPGNNNNNNSLGGSGGNNSSSLGDGGGGGGGGCQTTISGTVYDPAAKNPLYDIVVYIPTTTLQPFTSGASCDTCSELYTGAPVSTALTDASGRFTLGKVPTGANIPLVVQVGKWRMKTTIPNVTACQDNPLPDKTVRLPKNHTEGDIPNIAISTGNADTLECLLTRVGLDAAEYGGGAGGAGRIHIFQGGGIISEIAGGPAPTTSPAAPVSSASLWDSDADILPYDMVLLSCEGAETDSMNQQVLFDYAAMGGRVFASHLHYAWFNSGPFGSANLATWSIGANGIGNINATIATTLANGQPFPKGQALAQWLMNVNALTSAELPIADAKHNADVSASNTLSQVWISADQSSGAPGATQYFSFDTPLNVTPACGRVVFSDLHVGAASGDNTSLPVPQECTTNDLSPQEKALEFMLFDLSSCVTPNNVTPVPPPPTAQ